jgi:alkyl hydroperoxide reductase subunit AhpF
VEYENHTARGDEESPETAERLGELDTEDEVMVFVTPSCPYCPGAASIANRMAMSPPMVRSVVVEANEFRELARRHQVRGVPRTVVNGSGALAGALPGVTFVESVLRLTAGAAV